MGRGIMSKTLLTITTVLAFVVMTTAAQPAAASPESCDRQNPTLAYEGPSTQSGTPGESKVFTLSITNNDNEFCGTSEFTLANRDLPAGWAVAPATGTQWVDYGEIAGYALTYTSPNPAVNGDYTFTVDVSRAEQPGVVTSIAFGYTVVGGQTPPDTTAPYVAITSPSNFATVRKNSNLTIQSFYNDAVGVTQVDYLVDGNVVCSGLSATCTWHVPNQKKTYVLTAKAYDAAGNVGTSQPITVYAR